MESRDLIYISFFESSLLNEQPVFEREYENKARNRKNATLEPIKSPRRYSEISLVTRREGYKITFPRTLFWTIAIRAHSNPTDVHVKLNKFYRLLLKFLKT